jgi:hypothetical protein
MINFLRTIVKQDGCTKWKRRSLIGDSARSNSVSRYDKDGYSLAPRSHRNADFLLNSMGLDCSGDCSDR